MMDVALGGTLHQHVPDVAGRTDHSQQPPYRETSHIVSLAPESKRFFLGVQWHPEYLPGHAALFEAFADACR